MSTVSDITFVKQEIDFLTREGTLYRRLDEQGTLECYACGHRCVIKSGRRGICKVRFNEQGKLYVPWGYVGAIQCDPTEKKPFFHIYPGSDTLTFGMLGCDLHCAYCQNWETSQVLRDPHAPGGPTPVSPQQLIAYAKQQGARLVGSSYNEPLITSEWAVEVFQQAARAGLQCVYISNGNLTPEVLEFIRPHLIGYKIDLKAMRDKPYRQLGAVLNNILDGIKRVHDAGLWLEIVTLVVPGFNDSDAELRDAAAYIASVSKDIPWHVTAFHQDYKMTDPDNTDVHTLLRAVEIGKAAGLHFVYAGNMPGRVGPHEHTWCPSCHQLLIGRFGYVILEYNLTDDGRCVHCGEPIPGIWGNRADVRLGGMGDLFRRMPRPVRRLRSDVYEEKT
jgi:pyruvate formate lyase activating enzyme